MVGLLLNDELERDLEWSGRCLIAVLSRNFSGGTEKSHVKPVFRLVFKPSTARVTPLAAASTRSVWSCSNDSSHIEIAVIRVNAHSHSDWTPKAEEKRLVRWFVALILRCRDPHYFSFRCSAVSHVQAAQAFPRKLIRHFQGEAAKPRKAHLQIKKKDSKTKYELWKTCSFYHYLL
jgi:hypothetical protein